MKTTALLCKEYITVLNVLSHKFYNVQLTERTLEVEDYADTLLQMVQEVEGNMVPLLNHFLPRQDQGGEQSPPIETMAAPAPAPGEEKWPRESAEDTCLSSHHHQS